MRRSERPLPAGAALTPSNASRHRNCFFGTFSLRRPGVELGNARPARGRRKVQLTLTRGDQSREQSEGNRPAIASPSPAARVRTPSRFAGLVVLASRPCAGLRDATREGLFKVQTWRRTA